MEAIAAFSLACNILQVLDFSFNVIKGGVHIARAGGGAIPEHESAEVLAKDLSELTIKIQNASSQASQDAQLKNLCIQCENIAQELLTILRSLRPTKKRQLIWKSIRAQWDKPKIEALEQRLGDCRDEINLYITVEFQSRLDVHILQQTDAFNVLTKDSQANCLNLLGAVNDGVNQVETHLDQQDVALRNLRQDALQSHSDLQNKIEQASKDSTLALDNSTAQVLSVSLATQDVVVNTMTLNQHTVRDDVNGLHRSIAKVNEEIAGIGARLDEVVAQINRCRGNEPEREELQRKGNKLNNFLLSLYTLYNALVEVLDNLLQQARAFFGPTRFKELFGRVQSARPTQRQRRSRWSLPELSSLPRYDMSETGFHLVSMRVRLMNPTRKSSSNKWAVSGHLRSQNASMPLVLKLNQPQVELEEINTDIADLYYRYYYRPLFSNDKILSSRWKHREHTISNPLAEFRKNIRQHNVILGEQAAVLELARRGDSFVWFMAAIIAAIDSLVPESQTINVMSVVLGVIMDWQSKFVKNQETEASFAVDSRDVARIGSSILSLLHDHEDDIPTWQGKFDAKTVLGRRLDEDVTLWRRLAANSGLAEEMQQFVGNHLPWHEKVEASPYRVRHSERVVMIPAAQVAYLLIYFLMIGFRGMSAEVEQGGFSKIDVAFPISQHPLTAIWMLDVPRYSAAMCMARLLHQFGVTNITCKGIDDGKVSYGDNSTNGGLREIVNSTLEWGSTSKDQEAEQAHES